MKLTYPWNTVKEVCTSNELMLSITLLTFVLCSYILPLFLRHNLVEAYIIYSFTYLLPSYLIPNNLPTRFPFQFLILLYVELTFESLKLYEIICLKKSCQVKYLPFSLSGWYNIESATTKINKTFKFILHCVVIIFQYYQYS